MVNISVLLSSRVNSNDKSFAIFPHEFEQLLNALRRDYNTEKLASKEGVCGAAHRYNASTIIRLLDLLNPRDTKKRTEFMEKKIVRI